MFWHLEWGLLFIKRVRKWLKWPVTNDGMVGMMVREEVDGIIVGRMGNIHCLKTARDQNIPYMAGGGSGELRKTRTNVI